MTRDELHAAAMALPGATLSVQWGDDHIYKVGGKIFAGTDGGYTNLSLKMTDIAFEALTTSGRGRPAPYMARAKWVMFDDLAGLDADEVADWLKTAHQLVAAKLTRAQKKSWGSPEVTRQGLEAIAFGLPAVTRVVQWGGSDVYKVGGKVFAICGDDAVSFKVSEIGFLVLTEDGAGRQAPYCAKGQWVAVDLAGADAEDLAGWLATAHSLIAGKLTRKLRAELGLT